MSEWLLGDLFLSPECAGARMWEEVVVLLPTCRRCANLRARIALWRISGGENSASCVSAQVFTALQSFRASIEIWQSDILVVPKSTPWSTVTLEAMERPGVSMGEWLDD